MGVVRRAMQVRFSSGEICDFEQEVVISIELNKLSLVIVWLVLDKDLSRRLLRTHVIALYHCTVRLRTFAQLGCNNCHMEGP